MRRASACQRGDPREEEPRAAQDDQALAHARGEVGHPSPRQADREHAQRQDAGRGQRGQRRVLEEQRHVDLGQVPRRAGDGEEAPGQRPGDERGAEEGLEDGLRDEGRGQRRVAGAVDAPVHEPELHHVAAAGRDDAVEPRAGEVGGHRVARPQAVGVGVGGAQDRVPAAGADRLRTEVQDHAQRGEVGVDAGHVVHDEGERVPGGAQRITDHVLTNVAPAASGRAGAASRRGTCARPPGRASTAVARSTVGAWDAGCAPCRPSRQPWPPSSSAPPPGPRPGGTSAPPEPSGSPGGAEYGVPLRDAAAPAPVARAFRLAPARVTAPALPAVRLRVDQRGSRTVAANVVFAPVRGGTLRRLDLGQVAVGRTITVRWPAGFAVAPGRYLVRLHVVGRGGRVLARRASRAVSGRAALTVAPAPRRAAPAPALTPGDRRAPARPPRPRRSRAASSRSAAPTATATASAPRAAGTSTRAPTSSPRRAPPSCRPWPARSSSTAVQPGGAGWYVVLHADDGRSLFFAHCRAHTIVVSAGVRVAPGAPLCQVGHTGDATGPHLHLEIWVGGGGPRRRRPPSTRCRSCGPGTASRPTPPGPGARPRDTGTAPRERRPGRAGARGHSTARRPRRARRTGAR